MPIASPRTLVGISGWTYKPWRGTFYPQGLAHRQELEYASRQLPSIEINGSFYSLQTPQSYRRWHEATPDDFVFAIKGSRYITHMKRLRGVQTAVANFFASGVLRLAEKLGPILWQFPERMAFDHARFTAFLKLLPTTHAAAAKLAQRHDRRLAGRMWTKARHHGPIRYAFELRHPEAITSESVALLRKHNAALVFADTAGRWPYAEDVTADFIYIRLHGDKELYVSGYTDEALDEWSRRIRLWRQGREPGDAVRVAAKRPKSAARDVYVYFDNDVKVHAPYDAQHLLERLR